MAVDRRRVDKEIRLSAGEFVLLDVVEDDKTIRVRVVAARATGTPAAGDSTPPRRTATPNSRAAAAKKAPAKQAAGNSTRSMAPAKRPTKTNAKPAPRKAATNVATKRAARKRA